MTNPCSNDNCTCQPCACGPACACGESCACNAPAQASAPASTEDR
ncbi:hypothetical protein [Phenylobacterium sp.]|nr:hypothetical protein [Phenylobacterium sp.]MDP3635642.1 hypothetical protein [Phenylobacterium sp.]MDP3867226.1 hypothetical protein [Phenylobacterium sp.]